MGVNIKHQVVFGYYFEENVLNDLSDDQHDDLSNNNLCCQVSPMENGDFIIGEIVFQSSDARYDDGGFNGIFDITEEDLMNMRHDAEKMQIPEFLTVGDKEPKLYIYTCYS